MPLYKFYRKGFLSDARTEELMARMRPYLPGLKGIMTEKVFYVDSERDLTEKEMETLRWLIRNQHQPKDLQLEAFYTGKNTMEIAPLLNFETADSTNAVSISQSCTIPTITRLEQGRRYELLLDKALTEEQRKLILPLIHDKMTEGYYPNSLTTFVSDKQAEPVQYIPVLEEGMEALIKANREYGTGMDATDLKYYHYLFTEVYHRNPSDVEFLDLGNAFSNHSRHHDFNAKLIIDGEVMPFTLFELVKATLKNLDNSVIAFHDNGSAIKGRPIKLLIPNRPGFPSPARMVELLYHYVLTCETHNHPCLFEAENGAGTGGRGRVRDNSATGRGGIIGSGISIFMGGNLLIPGYPLPWENSAWRYDPKVESPLSFFRKATKGDFYSANEHGEPSGLFYAESYGFDIGGQRWENVKPIMFTGGISFIDSRHVKKNQPEKGMLIIKIGGKAFRVGKSGGAASSMMHGENLEELDWGSVQRVNGEMANKIDQAITTFVYMGDNNPIQTIEDQGAGGPLNNIKELMKLIGGKLYVRRFPIGDKTLSPAEILICEYQECMAFLIKPEDWELVKHVCDRLKCDCDAVGVITGDGKIVVIDDNDNTVIEELELKHLFGEYPQKTFEDKRVILPLSPLEIPLSLTVREAMNLVPRLLGVASREWLAHIVDRAVKAKLAQQMCVGPAQLPINHYSITAPSNFNFTGEANSVGHRPPIGFISPQTYARMTAADALMGIMFAPISKREEIKASANWMLAAKLPGGLAWLYDAAKELRDTLVLAKVDINGGKDSLSMATKYLDQLIRSLNTLVFTLEADCVDYRLRVTPDIKRPGESKLMFVDFAKGLTRLGGSAFAQVLKQVGDTAPDVDMASFCQGFDTVQDVLRKKLILAGQKKVRGGGVETIAEMAYASNCGLEAGFTHKTASVFEALFNEETGAMLEYLPQHENQLIDLFGQAGFDGHVHLIGRTSLEKKIRISFNGAMVLDEKMPVLRDIWRDTSYQLKTYCKTRKCVEEERRNLYDPANPTFKLTFDPDLYPPVEMDYPGKPRVAVLEEEGCNSRDEMMDFVYAGGFEPWPITMTDLMTGRASLKWFRGLTPVPGFSFKDVLDAGKGWAGVAKFNPIVAEEFYDFFVRRQDTWSYSPCNAAQFMMYLDYIFGIGDEEILPLFITNESEGFESRFSWVRIFKSPAIALRGMEGLVIPVHSDHGMGKLSSPDPKVIEMIIKRNLAPIRFVDMYGSPTNDYPFNPNGSPGGITGVVDPTGRHLAMMPHPERTHRKHHFHYWPREWEAIKNSPWPRVMHNYRMWCEQTEDLSIEPLRELYERAYKH